MSNAVLVIGGTRGTGKAVVEQLIEQGRSCTLLARNVDKAKALFGNAVDIFYGDVTLPESLQTVLTSEFAAIVYTVDITGGVGGRGFFASRQKINEIVYGGVVNTIDVIKAQGFKKQFILLTTLGLDKPSVMMTLLNMIKSGVVQASKDKAAYLIQSGLPYTIIQAGALHDGTVSRQSLALVSEELPMQMDYQISRHHLAQILVASISNPLAINKTFSVYGGQEIQLNITNIDLQLQKLK
jgi:NAD(P)-dependent dehydrogenase (short-subunit alcohol dehydrogenase family)